MNTLAGRMRGFVGLFLILVVVAACGGTGGKTSSTGGSSAAGGSAATLKIRDQAASLRTQAASAFAAARDGQGVVVGNTVRTNGTGFAQVDYRDGSLTRLDANAQLTLTDLSTAQQAQRIVAKLDGGRAWSRVKKITSSQGRYEIDTAVASASVRGTTFTVDCTPPDGSCIFTVTEGVVTVTPHGGVPVEVHAGESVTAHKDGKLTHDPAQSPDQLAQVPWIAKNAAIDTAEPAPGTGPTPSGSKSPAGTIPAGFDLTFTGGKNFHLKGKPTACVGGTEGVLRRPSVFRFRLSTADFPSVGLGLEIHGLDHGGQVIFDIQWPFSQHQGYFNSNAKGITLSSDKRSVRVHTSTGPVMTSTGEGPSVSINGTIDCGTGPQGLTPPTGSS